MDLPTLRGLFTLVLMIAFVVIVVWAWSGKRKAAFDDGKTPSKWGGSLVGHGKGSIRAAAFTLAMISASRSIKPLHGREQFRWLQPATIRLRCLQFRPLIEASPRHQSKRLRII